MHELHHPPTPVYWGMTAQELTQDVVQRHASPGGAFWAIAGVLAALFALGVVGFVLLVTQYGFEDRNAWGYYATAFAYIFVTAQSAVLVSVALRMAKAHWRRPLARISELFAAVGLFNFLLMIPLLWVLPPTTGRRSIWFDWPAFSPHIWDTVGMATLVLTGLFILRLASLPDVAAVQDHAGGSRPMNWRGTLQQWRVQRTGLAVLGGFYFMQLIVVHMLISIDFSMSLVPGWKDSIFPAFHALNGLQSGVALILVTMFILRQTTGLRKYLEVDQFWGLSKLLLAISLLWFYFWWSGFFVYWYGRTPAEQGVLKLIMFEVYWIPFFLAFVMCFALPFLILMWNIVRKTTWGPALAGAIVLVGTFFNVMRYYVPAFSIEDHTLHVLHDVPPVNLPNVADVLVVVGALAGAALAYMLTTRFVPIMSMWELREGQILQRVRKLMKIDIKVLAKPE